MKKLLRISIVLMCIFSVMNLTSMAVWGIDTKLRKCNYPAGILGAMEFPGKGFQMWITGTATTITVLGEKDLPMRREDGTIGTEKYYHFSGSYDKPDFGCLTHGYHAWEEAKSNLDKEVLENFYLPVSEATCK